MVVVLVVLFVVVVVVVIVVVVAVVSGQELGGYGFMSQLHCNCVILLLSREYFTFGSNNFLLTLVAM